MRGVATWVWIIVAIIGAVAIIYLGMSYGIIPLTGELGKWICYRQLASACEKYFLTQSGDLETVWTRCQGFFNATYPSAQEFCRAQFKKSSS